MAKDNSVAGLYLRLGLNYDELNQDFVSVEETIKSNVQRLSRESSLINLKAAIDLTGVTDAEQRLKIEQDKLTRLIEVQTQKVKLYESAWIDAGKSNGYASKQAQSAAIAFKQQELALARLSQQLKEVNAQQAALPKKDNSLLAGYKGIKGDIAGQLNNLTSAFNGITNATSSADAAISKSLEIIGNIPSPVGKAVAALASIPLVVKGIENSLLDMAKPAIAAGDALYVMSRGMQLSIADAAKLNMICKVTGIEITEVNSAMRRLSASLEKTGDKDNAATKMLERFGAQVRDSNGHVKDEITLINEVSQALLRAEKAGEGAAFRDIVGGRFWSGDLITFFEDYQANAEAAAKVVKNGLANPALAHDVQGNLNAMNAQIGQFKSAVSSAFMPTTQYIVPELTAQFGELTRVIAQNADGIKNVSMAVGEVVVSVSKATTEIAKFAAESTKLFATPTSAIVDKYKGDKDIQNARDLKNKILADSKTERDRIRALTTPDSYYEQDFQALQDTRRQDYLRRIEAAQNKIQAAEEKMRASIREQVTQSEAMTEERLKRIQDYAAELEKINIGIEFRNSGYEKAIAELDIWRDKAMELAGGNLDEQLSVMELYAAKVQQIELDKEDKLSEIREKAAQSKRTDLENTLADIEREKENRINAGMEAAEAIRMAAEESAAAIQNLEEAFSEKVNAFRNNALQNAYDAIDKDAQNWIQKGIDPAQANAFADEQKYQALQKLEEDFSKRVNEIRGNDLELQLARIEEEKQAWIDKGIDEVRAEELANEQKSQVLEGYENKRDQIQEQADQAWANYQKQMEQYAKALQDYYKRVAEDIERQFDSALSVLKSQLKEWKAFLQGGTKGLEDYYRKELAKQGISDKDLKSMTTGNLAAFQQAQKDIKRSLLPNFNPTSDIEKPEQPQPPDMSKFKKQLEDLDKSLGNATQSVEEFGNSLKDAINSATQEYSPTYNPEYPQNIPKGYGYAEGEGGKYELFNRKITELKDALSDSNPSNFDSDAMSNFNENFSEFSDNLTSLKDEFGNITQSLDENFAPITDEFSNITQSLSESFMPITDSLDNVTTALSDIVSDINELRSNGNSQQTQPVNVEANVSIDEAHAWDYDHIQELAEKVADVLLPRIASAIGGGSNSY